MDEENNHEVKKNTKSPRIKKTAKKIQKKGKKTAVVKIKAGKAMKGKGVK